MSQKEEKFSPEIMEYPDWLVSQTFQSSEEHHSYVSSHELNFLQNVIYPMFYGWNSTEFKTARPFPLVLKDSNTGNPIYVIDNIFFTIVFFSCENLNSKKGWKVSVHVKNHNFCNEPLCSFAQWFLEHYVDPKNYYIDMGGMPKEFLFPELDFCNEEIQDFCIDFWDDTQDFMLFKLLDLLRLF